MTEYLCSFLQEKFYGTVSWDYSNLVFNINGRTSLLHSIYWGTAGILYVKLLDPFLNNLKENIEKKGLRVFTVIITAFMVFDISISCLAADRQTRRRDKLPPQHSLDVFLDEVYPDEYMDKVYCNKKEV